MPVGLATVHRVHVCAVNGSCTASYLLHLSSAQGIDPSQAGSLDSTTLSVSVRQASLAAKSTSCPLTSTVPELFVAAQIEIGEQLSQAGSPGSASALTNVLVGLLGGKPSLNGQMLPQPSEAALVGFIVAVVMSELSRAALAPLPDLGESRT